MERTDNNLCNSCTNIGCEFQSGIVRTQCAFYMPPHIEPDNCGNYVVMQPTEKAIPKDNVYKAIQEIMKYEAYRASNDISLSRTESDDNLEKYNIMINSIQIGIVELCPEKMEISRLNIFEPYQNKGYGTKVVQDLIKQGYKTLCVSTADAKAILVDIIVDNEQKSMKEDDEDE